MILFFSSIESFASNSFFTALKYAKESSEVDTIVKNNTQHGLFFQMKLDKARVDFTLDNNDITLNYIFNNESFTIKGVRFDLAL